MANKWNISSKQYFRGKDEPFMWKKDNKIIGIVWNPIKGSPSYQVRLSLRTSDKGKAISRGKFTFKEAQKFAKTYMLKN